MGTPKQMIVMRRDLKMRKGKIAAQSGHACLNAVLMALEKEERLADLIPGGVGMTLRPTTKPQTPLSRWFESGTTKVCVYVDSLEALLELDEKAKELGILSALICDAGHTEFHGEPTYTCLALEPLDPETVAPLTGELPLY